MTIDYLCHSCFLVTTRDTTLLFDPWIQDPAFKGQWFLYPKPVGLEKAMRPEHILLTHGHEDHMHRPSLELLDKSAKVWFPFQWRAGIEGYMKHLGFADVEEAVTLRTYELGPDTRITYLAYSLESIVIIESEGLVVVNINDALNSNHENVVMMFLRVLKKRCPRIDILISGFSGAGYFPNQVRYPGKNDLEVGRIREHYFAHHLCRYVDFLKPTVVLPFAPGFALLEEHNRWINEVKFDRRRLPEYHAEHFGPLNGTRYIPWWPGDRLVDMAYQADSPYHGQLKDGSLYHLLDEVYAEEIREANTVRLFDATRMPQLRDRCLHWVRHNAKLFAAEVLEDARFSIRFTDVPGTVWNIHRQETGYRLRESGEPSAASRVIITTTARMLEHSLARVWGGDAMTAGYALTVDMFDEDALEKNLDIVCVRLVTRYPIMREDILKQPMRAAKYFVTNPTIASLHLKQKIVLRPYVNRYPYNERDHWISTTKCELCKVCALPEIEYGPVG